MAWWPFRRRSGRKAGDGTLELFREIFGYPETKAGQRVNSTTALQVATVLACARVLADGVAQVPLKLFKESADGRMRLPAKDHHLYWLLFRRPNPWQTSFQYRETLMLHLVLCGNHFSFINRVRRRIVELIPFEPGQVTVKRDERTWARTYEVRATESGAKQVFPQEAIWHISGPSWSGWLGLEPVLLAREAIGLSMAIEAQQAGFYARGAQTGGVYSIDGTLTDEQYKKLRDWIEKEHGGAANAWRPMVLDRGAKWLQQTLSGHDAQTLEQRKYQVEEICRAMRVMPIMVGHSDKTSTYASAEQMFLAHVVHSLAPWYERLEQDIDANLLTDEDVRGGVYAKFIEEGLLRGALTDTAEYLSKLTGGPIMSRNEARAKLDMNPVDDPEFDKPLTPLNMGGDQEPEPEPSSDATTTDAEQET